MKYKTTVFGNKTTTADLIRHLRKEGHAIDLVVTLSSEGKSGHDISGADDVETLARALGIAVYATGDYRLKTESDKKFFAENEFGIGLCTGWQRLLPAHVLAAFPDGVFGFHGSCWPFPDGRGRSPLNWSMRKGGDKVYHNCFKYVAAADAGEVFNTTEFPISAHDSISSVQFKALLDMKRVSHRLLTQYASGTIRTTAQKDGASIVLEKLTPEDGLIHFSGMPRAEILCLVNATSRPFPGAFARTASGDILRIWRAVAFDFPGLESAAPGQVVDASLGQVLIACKDGFLLCTDHEFSPAHNDTNLTADLRFA